MIWGPPGVGKSSIVRDIAKRKGIGFIDIRLAQREPIDIRGLPVPKEDGVHWVISSEWPRDPESKGIILFDELTAADRTLQVAAYEMILDRRLGDLYTVPKGWYIIGAGNRTSDRAASVTLSSALANRFMHVELEANVKDWNNWALKNNIYLDIIGFIASNPDYLFNMDENPGRGFPTPRSWERVSTMLKLAERNGYNEIVDVAIEGLVGVSAKEAFNGYIEKIKNKYNVLELMRNFNGSEQLPKESSELYTIIRTMVYYLWRPENKAEQEKLLDGFFKISLSVHSSFAILAMYMAIQGRGEDDSDFYSKKILEHKLYPDWLEKHGVPLKNLKEKLKADE
jgi:midasin (ATPase involved in ribosome maturation)